MLIGKLSSTGGPSSPLSRRHYCHTRNGSKCNNVGGDGHTTALHCAGHWSAGVAACAACLDVR
eukprot:15461122-Alexandrium_andersonii.AAC.1